MSKRTFATMWARHKRPFVGSVGEGWVDLVDRLLSDLKRLKWRGHVIQVKEKFGGLRFYVDLETDEVRARIREAEHESLRTCETCGQPGRPRRERGWIKTLCDERGRCS